MFEILILSIHSAIFGSLASVGFAILFNVPRFALVACAISGFLAIFVRTLLLEYNFGIEIATLISASLIGFIGLYFSNKLNAPTSIFTVTGSIPMVPGVYAFKGMIAVINIALAQDSNNIDYLLEASKNLIKTALILGAIGVGIAAPSLLLKRFRMAL